MSHIESRYDYRLVALVLALVSLAEDLSLELQEDSELIVAKGLAKQLKILLDRQDDQTAKDVYRNHPILLNLLDLQ